MATGLVGVWNTRSVRRDVIGGHFPQTSEDTSNLQTFLKIIILISVDKLMYSATIEDDAVVLLSDFAVTKDGVAGELTRNGRRMPLSMISEWPSMRAE